MVRRLRRQHPTPRASPRETGVATSMLALGASMGPTEASLALLTPATATRLLAESRVCHGEPPLLRLRAVVSLVVTSVTHHSNPANAWFAVDCMPTRLRREGMAPFKHRGRVIRRCHGASPSATAPYAPVPHHERQGWRHPCSPLRASMAPTEASLALLTPATATRLLAESRVCHGEPPLSRLRAVAFLVVTPVTHHSHIVHVWFAVDRMPTRLRREGMAPFKHRECVIRRCHGASPSATAPYAPGLTTRDRGGDIHARLGGEHGTHRGFARVAHSSHGHPVATVVPFGRTSRIPGTAPSARPASQQDRSA
ncbi:hypothetical protein Mal4_14530 [Maioricimonas rarisocia]|uniref:Uncharacterized protein n=1 Tax=Maioricimonas rarisocia TaxID=2528026 RepID=A0A517Z3Y3_9PLAN|nr:hypothetical protein Mal4_14530 [Maioricimonas rarisocia]